MQNSLLVLEIASVALGYQALNLLTAEAGVEIVDASPVGSRRFLVLASGGHEVMKEQLRVVREFLEGVRVDGLNSAAIVDHSLIEAAEPKLLESAFSLSQVDLAESLVAIDCASVSGLLAIGQSLIRDHHLSCIEIRIARSGSGGGSAVFTGPLTASGPAAEDARTLLKRFMRDGVVELIENPTVRFRKYFNFSGQAT